MKTAEAIAAIAAVPAPKRLHRAGFRTHCRVCGLGADIRKAVDEYVDAPEQWLPEDLALGERATGRYPEEVRTVRRILVTKAWLNRAGHDTSLMGARRHVTHRNIEAKAALPVAERSGAVALMNFYAEAIAVGNKALRMLHRRMQDGEGKALSNAELMKIAEIGGKYAASAAVLRSRPGQSPLPNDAGFMPPDKDERPQLDGFMGGVRRPRRARGGKLSIEVIDGESRPIRDGGPVERERFNERQWQQGGERL